MFLILSICNCTNILKHYFISMVGEIKHVRINAFVNIFDVWNVMILTKIFIYWTLIVYPDDDFFICNMYLWKINMLECMASFTVFYIERTFWFINCYIFHINTFIINKWSQNYRNIYHKYQVFAYSYIKI